MGPVGTSLGPVGTSWEQLGAVGIVEIRNCLGKQHDCPCSFIDLDLVFGIKFVIVIARLY